MKRRRLLKILVGCVAAMTLAFLVWPREREPEYDGAPLSEWLKRNFQAGGHDASCREALRHLGTNTVPFLLRWIQYETPQWRTTLPDIIGKLPTFLQNARFVQQTLQNGNLHRAELAIAGFSILGSEANSALPELRRLTDNPKAPETAARATRCLMVIGQRFPEGDFDPVF